MLPQAFHSMRLFRDGKSRGLMLQEISPPFDYCILKFCSASCRLSQMKEGMNLQNICTVLDVPSDAGMTF
jgi:hypothetical protein